MEQPIKHNMEWTEVIEPKGKWFDLKLKEVWRYRDLMLLFVKRDFVATYKQTVLGPLWHIIQPIITTLTFLILFNKIAKIPTDGVPPVLFYMGGLMIWQYFSTCLTATANIFVTNASIFGKVYFPRMVMPLSLIISNLIKFSINIGLITIVILYFTFFQDYEFKGGWSLFLLPVFVLLMAGLSLGMGIIISSLTTKYRDLSVLITFGVQLIMYVSPVAYPLSYLSQKKALYHIIKFNPLSPILEGFRYALFGVGYVSVNGVLYSTFCCIFLLLFGTILFNKVERSFMDTV